MQGVYLQDFRDDELRMSEVFENLLEIFITEQKIFRVKKENYNGCSRRKTIYGFNSLKGN